MKVKFNYWKDGKRKALTMSYDDGMRADLRLLDIFNANGIRGTFHLNAGMRNETKVTPEEIARCYAGHEISAHTLSHHHLECVPREEICYEVIEDRRRLEEMCGYPVCGASYPYGTYNSEVVEALRVLGYRYCRTVASTGKFALPDDFMRWHPTCHHEDKMLLRYPEKLRNSTQPLALLYVWGHSYEFDRNDNWERIEHFCREIGGDPDIWYATNIEIYDYVTALRALRFSVDRTFVYNPTATDVFVSADGVCVRVAAGATTDLEEEVKKHESEEK